MFKYHVIYIEWQSDIGSVDKPLERAKTSNDSSPSFRYALNEDEIIITSTSEQRMNSWRARHIVTDYYLTESDLRSLQ